MKSILALFSLLLLLAGCDVALRAPFVLAEEIAKGAQEKRRAEKFQNYEPAVLPPDYFEKLPTPKAD